MHGWPCSGNQRLRWKRCGACSVKTGFSLPTHVGASADCTPSDALSTHWLARPSPRAPCSIPGHRPDEPLRLRVPSCGHAVGNGIKNSESKASFHTHRLIKKRIGPASGWHALISGWKLHLVSAVAAVWIPLAAQVTPANVADSDQAPFLLRELPLEVRFVLGDRHYHRNERNALCFQDGRLLVTTRYGRYPHADAGVEVPRMFHKLREWRSKT